MLLTEIAARNSETCECLCVCIQAGDGVSVQIAPRLSSNSVPMKSLPSEFGFLGSFRYWVTR